MNATTGELEIDSRPPDELAGAGCWDFAHEAWRVRFVGRGAPERAEGLFPARARAWLQQVHGDRVVEARPGACGAGDALLVGGIGVVACVATADCVPVAIVAGRSGVLVHAGWRGIAAGVVERALDALGDRRGVSAWIGPAIGPCCYEVGEEVARAVVSATGESALRAETPGGRPRLDLRRAVAAQLRRGGVRRPTLVDHCTRCRAEWLWSYRRERERAGRNWSLLWREE
ncbi:MAG TPA: polyphenol oxidase family protein [Thermoanaerobaculia bacterium]|nr:polyphenol oxidase family protein [Thermoanaerobaculia bacterium]